MQRYEQEETERQLYVERQTCERLERELMHSDQGNREMVRTDGQTYTHFLCCCWCVVAVVCCLVILSSPYGSTLTPARRLRCCASCRQ